MVRTKIKWKFVILINIILFSVFTKSLPIERVTQNLEVANSNTVFTDTEFSQLPVIVVSDPIDNDPVTTTEALIPLNGDTGGLDTNATGISNALFRNIRPGQDARQYSVAITINGRSFDGRAVIQVRLTDATREDPLAFHVEDLNILSVRTGIFTEVNAIAADFNVDDGILEIEPQQEATNYIVVIEYTGSLDGAVGLYEGDFNGVNYLAMNLHATNARRVFPCMDELTEASTISFTFNNIPYNNIVMNSRLEDNSANQFRPLQNPASLWGMVAHNFNNINNPTANVQLHARPGVSNQENQASVAINYYFNNLEEWTSKTYTEIVLDQDGRMLVIALPDIHKDWYALSTVCIWEPYVLMDRIHSVKQRKEALIEISEAMTRQWFGYVIHPENWRFQWVVTGLSSYAAFDLNREFQSTPGNTDVTLIDFNTIFVSDVIQEALYRDAYAVAQPLEPADNLFDEDAIRDHIYGLKLLKYKAPALMWMMNLILGSEERDFIKSAAQILVNSRSLETVNSLFFVDAINSDWLTLGNGRVGDVEEFLEPWIQTNGYPAIHVGLRQGGVILTQERFGFSSRDQVNYEVPITWTSSINPNFEMDNVRSIQMTDGTMTINVPLGDEDFVLFNIQGQGYYRVNYDVALWERIIEALEDPDQRERIHPLNRATLVDDALNLARAGMLDYEFAFQVVLSMEHEIEYPVWKAFVRNMNFLRKRLVAYIDDEDDLDPDIYLRMVRRTVGRVEREIGFYPEFSATATEPSMEALTRGLVMDHACRANYQPCIAAAVDWFYDPDIRDSRVVNPNIPHEIRPAVYCTMVREGDDQVLNALYERLDIESVLPWSTEEKNRIFAAVAESSYANAQIAMNFISSRTDAIRRAYGGEEKLEELIWILTENMADGDLSGDFNIWVTSTNSDLDDSELTALRANAIVRENLAWDAAHMEYVYEWIDDNDAPTLAASLMLILSMYLLTVFNR
ncbi:hypothetical protein MSG28_003044 [Choristoneura fumiferana]|uniref:Uncharacterized protein n=1 Tax=Choristoneura fumiferana TaxID=7141 RepID=A0ACC0JKF3_CHOFU|nr:hypothetical protein MSG28_003044 [Choristoneura fumiferana]